MRPAFCGCLDVLTATAQFAAFSNHVCQEYLLIKAVHSEYAVYAVREPYDGTLHPCSIHLDLVKVVGHGMCRGLGKLAAAGLGC